jgi:poly-gamma-glutamate synthesis protein (capsule biosynthesis protein)
MRSFIDAGASIVYGHHSHIPQGYESYEGGLIMYGLGNFVVDPKRWANTKNALWSNVYSIDFKEGEENGLEAIQCKLIDSNSELKVKKLNKIEKEEYILNCNKPLNNRAFLRALWQEYSVKMYKKVYSNWLNLSFNKKNLKSFAKSLISNKNNKLLLYHLFSCSSHTNAIETALGVLNGEIEDLRTKETKKLVNKYAQT